MKDLPDIAYRFANDVQQLVLRRWNTLRLDDIQALAKILDARLRVEAEPAELERQPTTPPEEPVKPKSARRGKV